MILVNGSASELRQGQTIAEAIARVGVELPARGVAVAVDGEVVPRPAWDAVTLRDGARVEVLTAMQGG